MPPLLKNLLRGAALLLVLAGAALGLALATFNPNDYKTALIEQVKQRTQRTLHLPGDVSLRYFPRLALALGPMSLSEPDSAAVFASVEQAQVSLALWPLWRQRFVADQVQISGLSLHLQRDAQGRGNWASLGEPESVHGPVDGAAPASAPSASPAPPAGPVPVAIELDGLSLTGSRVRFTDAARPGQSLDVQFDLHTGPLQSGKPTALRLHAQVHGAQPALALTLDGQAELRIDPALTGVQWQGLSADLSGNAGTLQALQLALKSPQGELTPARLSAPSLSFTAQGRQPDGRAWSARGGADVQGDRGARRWQAQALQVTGTLTPPGGDEVRLTGQGLAQLDEAAESAHLDLTGQLDGSAFEVSAGVSAWLQPAYTLNLAIDRLDVDHYQRALAVTPEATAARHTAPSAQTPSVPTGPTPGPARASVPLEPPADEPPWAALQARGQWQVQSLTVAGLHAQDVQATWQIKAGQLAVSPLSASLYGGRLNGSLLVQASDPPQWAAQQRWRGVSLGPLLRDAGQTDRLEGVADGELDLRSTGTTPQALTRALQGRVRVAVNDGAIKGVNLAALIRQAQQKVSQWQGGSGASEPASEPEQTDFSALSASFQIQNGVARNRDLVAQSPLLRVGGQGTVDLVASRLDYTVRATVVPTLQGQGGPALQALRGITVPVRLSGPLDAVAWEVDRAALARELIKAPVNSARIKAEVQRQLEAEKESLQNRLKNQLNKLWGR